MKKWGFIFKTVLYNHKLIIALIFLGLIITGVSISIPWIMKDIIDTAITGNDTSEINRVGIKVLLLSLLMYIIYIVLLQVHVIILQKGMYKLRKALYENVMRQSLSVSYQVKTGEIMHHIDQDTELFERHLDFILGFGPHDVFSVIGILGLMLYTSPLLASVIFGYLFLSLLLTIIIGKPLLALTNIHQSAGAKFNAKMQDIFSGLRTVKTFGREELELKHLNKVNQKISELDKKVGFVEAFIDPISHIMEIGGLVIIIWLGANLIIKDQLTAGQLIAFLLYIEILSEPFSRVADYFEAFRICSAVTTRINSFMAKLKRLSNDDIFLGTSKYSTINELSIENIKFKYPKSNREILKNISFNAKKNEVTALVGRNGAGKSTIVDLIIGIRPTDTGKIKTNNKSIYNFKEKDWRKHVGILNQDTHLFNDTIRNNILYGKLNATEKDLDNAIKYTGLNKIISKLPKGLETVVGEKGNKFSGGERQKISLARIFIQDPDLIIFDEPANHLDSESIKEIINIINITKKEKVVILIEHRVEVLQKINPKVVFLNDGEILEIGTHEELFANSKEYKKLFSH